MLGILLILLPIVMTLLIFMNHGDTRRQTVVVATTALFTLVVVAGYTLAFGSGPGDTWMGIVLLSVGPYAAARWVLELRVIEHRPRLILVLVPLAFVLSLFIMVLIAVNIGLTSAPF